MHIPYILAMTIIEHHPNILKCIHSLFYLLHALNLNQTGGLTSLTQ